MKNNNIIVKFQYFKHKLSVVELEENRDGDNREFDVLDVTEGRPGDEIGHISINTNLCQDSEILKEWIKQEAKAEVASLFIE